MALWRNRRHEHCVSRRSASPERHLVHFHGLLIAFSAFLFPFASTILAPGVRVSALYSLSHLRLCCGSTVFITRRLSATRARHRITIHHTLSQHSIWPASTNRPSNSELYPRPR